jgi:hypothetical protein
MKSVVTQGQELIVYEKSLFSDSLVREALPQKMK